MQKDQIIEYYENCERDYQTFWDLDHSMAMHAGYWDETTKSLREALKRENEVLAEKAGIKSTDRVLDAGCGVGGSSIFLARWYGCQVIGISLSQKQIQRARSYAFAAHVKPVPEFRIMDYTRTDFKEESFNVVWALESVCHAADKQAFSNEAYRLLAPGGCLIVADGFATHARYEPNDLLLMQRWLKGWSVGSLATQEGFKRNLEEAGFNTISFEEITTHVQPSSKRLFLSALLAYPFYMAGEWLGLRTKQQNDNMHAARHQFYALRRGLWQYGIFVARK